MALIDSQGQPIADAWSYPDSEGRIAVRAHAVVPADALAGAPDAGAWERPIGALLSADHSIDLIAGLLERLDLVVIAFPKFRDGRGFTLARTLREKHGFLGEIRALGHVLPDQLSALAQCGFTSIVTPAEHPPEQWRGAVGGRGQLLNRLMGGRGATPAGEKDPQ